MYIAFDLLAADLGINDKSSQAGWVNHVLHQELGKWHQKHNVDYHVKTVKYITRVVLEPDEMYSFFAMTWNPRHPELRNYQVVEPMSLDNH